MKIRFNHSAAFIIPLFLSAMLFFSCSPVSIIPNNNVIPHDVIKSTLKEHSDEIETKTVLYSEAENENERLDNFYATLYLGSGSDDIDLEIFESYCVVSVPAGSASEIGILKVKDRDDIDAVIDLLKAHFIRIIGNFSSYIEEEAKIARNAEIRIAGNYIYYVAAVDKEPILNTIELLLTIK